MMIKYRGSVLERETTKLDNLVMDFISVLDKNGISYVIVSGYVAILFGRSRTSEDVDIIMEKIGEEKFSSLWKSLGNTFDCIITENEKEAYYQYLSSSIALRFSKKGEFIPNMEIKFPSLDMDELVLREKEYANIGGSRVCISPMEIQIPFKLFLGSGKDVEDARHLYLLFKNSLNKELLWQFLRRLGQEENFRRYLDGSA